jgi:hypothetical protein
VNTFIYHVALLGERSHISSSSPISFMSSSSSPRAISCACPLGGLAVRMRNRTAGQAAGGRSRFALLGDVLRLLSSPTYFQSSISPRATSCRLISCVLAGRYAYRTAGQTAGKTLTMSALLGDVRVFHLHHTHSLISESRICRLGRLSGGFVCIIAQAARLAGRGSRCDPARRYSRLSSPSQTFSGHQS